LEIRQMTLRDRLTLVLVTAVLLGVAAAGAIAQTPATAPTPTTAPATTPARAGQCFALIVTGQSGSKVYARRFADWTGRVHAYLTSNALIPAGNVVVLCGDKELVDKKAPMAGALATADSVAKAISEMSRRVAPQDQFVLVMIGHGSLCNSRPQFVLPGRQLDADQLGKALSVIQAKNQVILDFSGSSGDFLKVLASKYAQPGRVDIAATRGGEQADPVFCEFFLAGLETGKAHGASALPQTPGAPVAAAAGAAKAGPVTLLEAFNWASYQSAQWISRQQIDDDGNWVVKGKETVALFKKLYTGDEGEAGARKMSDESDAAGPDAVVDLANPKDVQTAKVWDHRRIINEHATLDDASGLAAGNGAAPGPQAAPGEAKDSEEFVGATALDIDAGYKPVSAGKAGEQGNLAAGTVLGKCDRMGTDK
jgi:hypothetical protein